MQLHNLREHLIRDADAAMNRAGELAERAVSLDPAKRYEVLSEFLYDLRHPNAKYIDEEGQICNDIFAAAG